MEKFSLVGIDGNAYSVMGYVSDCMKTVGFTREQIDEYIKSATSSDYSHLLAVSCGQIRECNDKLAENDCFAKFGPGTYFIGDICYALPEEIYDEVWGDKYGYENGSYEGFAVHGTAYGDGCYLGSDGISYAVDAGVIGVTDITKGQRYDNQKLSRLGKIVEVQKSLIMNCDEDGNFEFIVDGKHFEIITSCCDEDDEDYEY